METREINKMVLKESWAYGSTVLNFGKRILCVGNSRHNGLFWVTYGKPDERLRILCEYWADYTIAKKCGFYSESWYKSHVLGEIKRLKLTRKECEKIRVLKRFSPLL